MHGIQIMAESGPSALWTAQVSDLKYENAFQLNILALKGHGQEPHTPSHSRQKRAASSQELLTKEVSAAAERYV